MPIKPSAVNNWKPGDPKADSRMGPVISETQWNKIQGLIQSGIKAGAKLDAVSKTRLGAINEELASLGAQFGQNVLADEPGSA